MPAADPAGLRLPRSSRGSVARGTHDDLDRHPGAHEERMIGASSHVLADVDGDTLFDVVVVSTVHRPDGGDRRTFGPSVKVLDRTGIEGGGARRRDEVAAGARGSTSTPMSPSTGAPPPVSPPPSVDPGAAAEPPRGDRDQGQQRRREGLLTPLRGRLRRPGPGDLGGGVYVLSEAAECDASGSFPMRSWTTATPVWTSTAGEIFLGERGVIGGD